MKEEITTEHVAKQHHLHCACGAIIVTGEKTTCTECGKRGWSHGKGTRGRSPAEANLWPPACISPARMGREASDFNKQFKRLGFLVLLVGALSIILFVVPRGTVQQWLATADNPRPRDCDWTSIPVGDKHCHYESRVSHFDDNQGAEHIIIDWHRVND
jgi:hypothetical protein